MRASHDQPVLNPMIRLRLFCPIEALSVDGQNVLPRGRKAQAILCYLALTQDVAVLRRRLVELLWSTRWEDQGRASLRQSLVEIRNSLGGLCKDLLIFERDSISLDRSRVWIDGLTRQPGNEEPGTLAPQAAGRLMEALEGLDPRFDEWLIDIRRQLGARVPGKGGSDLEARPAAANAPRQEDPGGLVLSVAQLIQVGMAPIAEHLAPALTQELVTALARCRWIQVRLHYGADRCDARYRLEGYITRVDDDLRIVMRLIDQADHDVIVWTDVFVAAHPVGYGTIADIVVKIVQQLDPEILAIETRKALRRSPGLPESYDCLLRAIPLLYEFEVDAWREATALLHQAVQLDPHHGRALAFSALCRLTGLAQGWSANSSQDLRQIAQEAERAMTCDPRDSLALALSGHIKAFLHHDFGAARLLFERAIQANPSCGFAWGYSSLTFAYQADTCEAARRLARAQAIMIHDPFRTFMDGFGAVVAFFSSDWDATLQICNRQLERRPGLANIRKLMIGALCFTGRFEDARRQQRIVLDHEPKFNWSHYLIAYPFGRAEDRKALARVLSMAGLTSLADIDGPPDVGVVAYGKQSLQGRGA